jgi:hypothetical protein
MRKSEAIEVVMLLVGAFPQAKFDAVSRDVYERMLLDLDAPDTRSAVQRLIRSSRFLPSIAEIRRAVADATLGPKRSGAEAWIDVAYEIRRVGYCGTPRFDDDVTRRLVDRWGWRRLCLEGSWESDRARFIEAYDEIAGREREGRLAAPALSLPTAIPSTAPCSVRPPAPGRVREQLGGDH